jgi:hypothetical protein
MNRGTVSLPLSWQSSGRSRRILGTAVTEAKAVPPNSGIKWLPNVDVNLFLDHSPHWIVGDRALINDGDLTVYDFPTTRPPHHHDGEPVESFRLLVS